MATGVPYVINFTDPTVPGKTPFIVQPGTTDGPLSPNSSSPDSSATQIHTSVVLPGMGLVQYGGRVAMTLVHLMEHFASATAPVAPTIGQIWYDYGNSVCKVWNGTEWAYVGSPWYYIASTDEYNVMVNLLNKIMGPATGTTAATGSGYGQAPLPLLAETVKPLPSDWMKLFNAMVNCGAHQGTSTASLPETDFRVYSDPTIQTYGIASLLNWYQLYLSVLSTLNTNRFLVDPTTLETTIPFGATSSRTTQWNTNIQQQIVYTFANDAAMRAYFNAGGSITVTPSINSNSGTANAAWYALFSGIGTATISALATTVSGSIVADTGKNQYTGNGSYRGAAPGVQAGGFYELYAAGDNVLVPLMYVGLGSGISTYNGITGFWLYGQKSSVNGTLTLTVTLENGYTAGAYLYDSIGTVGSPANPSTIMVSQTLTKPAPIQLNNPEIEYPFATVTILLTQGGYFSNSAPPPPPPVLTITYPASVVANTEYSWSIANGPANGTWYADVTWEGGRIPPSGTFSLDSTGSASYSTGIIPTVGEQIITWYFSDGETAEKTVNVTAPASPSIPGSISYVGLTSLGEVQVWVAVDPSMNSSGLSSISYACSVVSGSGSFDELNGDPSTSTLTLFDGNFLHADVNLNKGNTAATVEVVFSAPGYAATPYTCSVPAN